MVLPLQSPSQLSVALLLLLALRELVSANLTIHSPRTLLEAGLFLNFPLSAGVVTLGKFTRYHN